MSLISIVIPVYNAESTLSRCLDSIITQTYTDFELLLVNDGSNDDSGEICDEYARRDSRVRVFHKENGGVSSARNIGLDYAQGEWITFVDSDDYLEANYFNALTQDLSVDLVVGKLCSQSKKSTQQLEIAFIDQNKDIKQLMSIYLGSILILGVYAKLYRRSLIGKLRFNIHMRLGEDALFVYRYIGKCSSVKCVTPDSIASNYIYISPNVSTREKYPLSVSEAVASLIAINDAYESLNCKCIDVEGVLPSLFYDVCADDMIYNYNIWYKNREIKRICIRRSRNLGLFYVIKTWITFIPGTYKLLQFVKLK